MKEKRKPFQPLGIRKGEIFPKHWTEEDALKKIAEHEAIEEALKRVTEHHAMIEGAILGDVESSKKWGEFMGENLSKELNALAPVEDLIPEKALNDQGEQYQKVDNVYYQPSWGNKPPSLPPIIEINGVPILHYQNVGVLTALPGSGKSSVCEAICSNVINPECDSFGINLIGVDKMLFIDGERSHEDVYNSYVRMMKRAGISEGGTQDKVVIDSQVEQMEVSERKSRLIKLIEKHSPQLVLLDGIGDFAEVMNDEKESKALGRWLKAIASKNKVTFLISVHPNEGDVDSKARGHVGREFSRIAECVLVIKFDKASGLRMLTTDYSSGKNRNAGKVETFFTFSDELKMMVSSTSGIEKKSDAFEILDDQQINEMLSVVMEDNLLGYTELIQGLKTYIEKYHKERINAGERKIKEFKKWMETEGFIKVVTGERFPKYKHTPKIINQLSIDV
jgi:hypothetical protein